MFSSLTSNKNSEAMYSVLLTAYTTGNRHVGFGVDGCREGTGNNYPLIYRVDLES